MKRAIRVSAIAVLALSGSSALAAPVVTPSSATGFTITITGADVDIIRCGSSGGNQDFTIATTSPGDPIGIVTVRNTVGGIAKPQAWL